MVVFERSEFEARLAEVRHRMADLDLEALVCTNPANMNYLTGYDGWSFYVHQCVVISHDRPPLWIGRRQDAAGARATVFMSRDDIIGYPDDYVQNREKHPYSFVANQLTMMGLDHGMIGVESDTYYYSAAADAALRAGLPNATIVDSGTLVNWVRAIKSDAEIALMRQAAQIAEASMRAAIDTISPGIRQCDAVAEIMRTQISGTAEFGGDYTAIVPLLPTGKSVGAPHLTWSDTPFQEGEGTIIELAGCRHRYHCPLARTVFLGTPPMVWSDTAQVVVEGVNAALDVARPGATCEEVEAAWRSVINSHGIDKDSRLGYSIGLNYPPDWGEHTMSLRAGDRTVLKPNMTFHLIPGIWQDDLGIEISEAFHVTESGAERFTALEQTLFVKS